MSGNVWCAVLAYRAFEAEKPVMRPLGNDTTGALHQDLAIIRETNLLVLACGDGHVDLFDRLHFIFSFVLLAGCFHTP